MKMYVQFCMLCSKQVAEVGLFFEMGNFWCVKKNANNQNKCIFPSIASGPWPMHDIHNKYVIQLE